MIARIAIGVLLGRTFRLAVPFYLASLVLALSPGLVVLAGFGALAGDRPWRSELLGPGWFNLLAELLSEAIYAGGSPVLLAMSLASLLLVPIVAVATFVVYGFLAGGAIACLFDGHPDRQAFRAGARRWFWPMLRLSLTGAVMVIAISGIVQTVTAVVGAWVPPNLALGLTLAAQGLVFGWLELARALVVLREDGRTFRALRLAASVWRRPPVLLLWLALLVPTGGLGLAAINPPAPMEGGSAVDLLVSLLYGQGIALLLAWSKVVRLLVATRLALSVRTPAPVSIGQ